MRASSKVKIIHTSMALTLSLLSAQTWAFPAQNVLQDLPSFHPTHDHEKYLAVKNSVEAREILSDPEHHALSLTQKVTGPSEIYTTKFQHYYDGLEVLGSMSFHHVSSHGVNIRNHLAQFDLDTHPTLSMEEAISLAQGEAEDLRLLSLPKLMILPQPEENNARLIYWVSLRSTQSLGGQDILIDAHSGQKIAELPHAYTLAAIQIYSAENQGIQAIRNYTKSKNPKKKSLKNCDLINLSTHEKTTLSPAACFAVYQGASPLIKGKCQVLDGESGDLLNLDVTGCNQVIQESQIKSHSSTPDRSAIRAADHSRVVLEYYQNHFNRNSYDNQGSDLVSVVHAGKALANAMWITDLNTMVYGDGDGENMGDMTLALDVAGHEMTHGITEQTAKLVMEGEPGALNEAFSDFFGKLIENRGNWMMGGDLFPHDTRGLQGIRNIAEPSTLTDTLLDARGKVIRKPYPTLRSEEAKVKGNEPCSGENDYCYVHYNSTIPSHAAYLILQALGAPKAELLYYTTLTQNLSATDDFTSASKAIVSTCQQLDFSTNDCDSVKNIFSQVGLLPAH